MTDGITYVTIKFRIVAALSPRSAAGLLSYAGHTSAQCLSLFPLQKSRQAYTKFLSRLFTHSGPETVAVVFGGLTQLRSRAFDALRRTLPEIPKRELAWRYLFLVGSVHYTAAQIGYFEVISGGECKSGDLDTALAHFIAAQAATLSAPPAGALERRRARKFNKLPATATAPAAPAMPAATAATAAPARPRARRRAAAYDSIT